jgi:hypothetical protein
MISSPVQQLRGLRPSVRLHDADDHVGAAFLAAAGLPEHREGLADTRGGAEVDPQVTASGHR